MPSQHSSYQHQQPQNIAPTPTAGQYPPRTPNAVGGASYRDPPPIEVYTLPDQANLSIPAEVREQYQRDEFGRVLFFTTPPVVSSGPGSMSNGDSSGAPTGHSIRYLAARARRKEVIEKRRQEAELERQQEERVAKKARLDANQAAEVDIEKLKKKALGVLERQLARGVLDGGESGLGMGEKELGDLSAAQRAMSEQMQAVRANGAKRREMRRVRLDDGGGRFRDDFE